MGAQSLRKFISYVHTLKGDESSEAQVFCDRLFQAFGHEGYKEAGATLECKIKRKGYHTKFADLVWKPNLLLEMKTRGEKLEKHYHQVFDYWTTLVPNRPRYVVLCNFDEFWIYDFDQQIDDPMDKISLEELENRATAFNFLLPKPKSPIFQNNRVEVTKDAAHKVASVFNMLIERQENRERTQRFILQCVVAMFAEDIGLLPDNLFLSLLEECRKNHNSYDLLGGLFNQMNSRVPARAGRYANVPYFNGGIFSKIEPIELTDKEIEQLHQAATENWSKINPAIFGTIFQNSMEQERRHSSGAYYTSEADIQRIVFPTIVKPWKEKITTAKSLKDLMSIQKQLHSVQVLDPACGSGNFLYVGFRELRRIELSLLIKIYEDFGGKAFELADRKSVSIKQFFGIEKDLFGAELAKVTLMLAKQLSLKESHEWLQNIQKTLHFDFDYSPLPLDNLDKNISCKDALFSNWPKADIIIGNPPFLAKNKMQKELGIEYVKKVRNIFPDVPGRADYCVYWFRKAHDHLNIGGRAGFVGTNTIRQNYSREGSLDYILSHGGTITEAVAEQLWGGDAGVHVSIVNWVKGEVPGKKKLFLQKNNGEWEQFDIDRINSSLSITTDVTNAFILDANTDSNVCYQGQTHGHPGFLLLPSEAAKMIRANKKNREVIFPYLIGKELVGRFPPHPQRYVIDFQSRDIITSSTYQEPFQHIKKTVLPDKENNPEYLLYWWHLWRSRGELIQNLSTLKRYIACSRTTQYPIFEFVSATIHPNDSLQVFALQDDYSYGIIQSKLHLDWFINKCSTFRKTPRYTSNTVFDTFPWPQSPQIELIEKIAKLSSELRKLRLHLMEKTKSSLRDLYKLKAMPGDNPLRDAHEALDRAVFEAYGINKKEEHLEFLLKLNHKLHEAELRGIKIEGPGLPISASNPEKFISNDCIAPQEIKFEL